MYLEASMCVQACRSLLPLSFFLSLFQRIDESLVHWSEQLARQSGHHLGGFFALQFLHSFIYYVLLAGKVIKHVTFQPISQENVH